MPSAARKNLNSCGAIRREMLLEAGFDERVDEALEALDVPRGLRTRDRQGPPERAGDAVASGDRYARRGDGGRMSPKKPGDFPPEIRSEHPRGESGSTKRHNDLEIDTLRARGQESRPACHRRRIRRSRRRQGARRPDMHQMRTEDPSARNGLSSLREESAMA